MIKNHPLKLDFSHAETAVKYLENKNHLFLKRLCHLPATAHMSDHASFFTGIREEAEEFSLKLLEQPGNSLELAIKNLEYLKANREEFKRTVTAEAAKWLPTGCRLSGTLYFTYGYTSVVYKNSVSLNLADSHFFNNPAELKYFAVYKLHHLGFWMYQEPPNFKDIKTYKDLLDFIEFRTLFEGMAAYAAQDISMRENTLGQADYQLLEDEEKSMVLCTRFFSLYHEIEAKGAVPVYKETINQMIETFANKERLFFRVGCFMCLQIDHAFGTQALIQFIGKPGHDFFELFKKNFCVLNK